MGKYLSIEDQLGRYQIFQSTSHALKQSDVDVAGPSSLLPAHDLVQIANHVAAIHNALVDRNKNVPGFCQSAFEGIDNNASAFDSFIVNLARMRPKGSNKIEVRARTYPFSFKQWLSRRGTGTNHIGFPHAGFSINGFDLNTILRLHPGDKVRGIESGRSANKKSQEVTYLSQHS